MPINDSERHRRSIRLREYDYTLAGGYFITICTHQRQPLFGTITDGVVTLSRAGEIVRQCWLDLPRSFPFVELDAFVVMPNHMHGVIVLITDHNRGNGEGEAFPLNLGCETQAITGNASPLRPQLHLACGTRSGSLPAIIQNYKSDSTRKVNKHNKTPGSPLWQRNYYEYVIRNHYSLDEIRDYIEANPSTWLRDEYNADNR